MINCLKIKSLKSLYKPNQLNFSTISSPIIFDHNAKRIQKDRAARAQDSQVYDYLKQEFASRLADRVLDIKRKFPIALDIGCQKGFLGAHLSNEVIDCLFHCDTSIGCLDKVKGIDGIKTFKLLMDEEHLNFRENQIDIVLSSLSLHWVNDLPLTFSQIFKLLKNDGVFMASMFGGQTLYELRCSLQLAEIERSGGFSPRISPFIQPQDIGSLLNRSGFTMITIDTDEIKVNYPTMFELIQDLKGMAENNVLLNRNRPLHRDTLISAAAIYKNLYGDQDGNVPATFQIYNFIGWKPDESQNKPVKRGSATASIKDISKDLN